jgi:hypothetical protein
MADFGGIANCVIRGHNAAADADNTCWRLGVLHAVAYISENVGLKAGDGEARAVQKRLSTTSSDCKGSGAVADHEVGLSIREDVGFLCVEIECLGCWNQWK